MQINQTTDRTTILNKLMGLTVNKPEEVKVVENQLRNSTEFFVSCADGDYGKLVGRAGLNVKAWWTVVDAASLKAFGIKGMIVIKTPPIKTNNEPQKFVYDPAFTDAALKTCATDLCSIIFDSGVVEVSSSDPSQAFVQITAHGYLHESVAPDRLEDAIDRVLSCIGNAHGRHIKAEVNFRTDEN